MSKLLEYGFKPDEVAKIEGYVATFKACDKFSLDSLRNCRQTHANYYRLISNRNMSLDAVNKLLKELYNITHITCAWSSATYPDTMMVQMPNGRYMQAELLLNESHSFGYDENKKIVPLTRLYGDRDILAHNADPLQYLKFKCLPTEKLEYSLKEDSFANSDYNGYSPVFLGIELEVEKKASTPKRIEHSVVGDLGSDYVVLKHDGSLENGFEIVTAPSTIGYHLQAWDKFFDNSAKHLTSWSSSRCGMHVHINRKCFTPLHLGKLIAFLNNVENRDFVTTVAGRTSTYAKFIDNNKIHQKTKLISELTKLNAQLLLAKAASKPAIEAKIQAVRSQIKDAGCTVRDMLTEIERSGVKYSALRLDKPGTVEVRIFRGNVSKIGMLKNLEFVHAAVQFTREATFRTKVLDADEIKERKLKRKENTDYALHFTYFLDWLQKDTTGNYNNLKLWLQTHKITDKFTRKKQSSKAPPNKRISEDDIRAVI